MSVDGRAGTPELKRRTGALSIISNSGLILLKVIVGTLTESE